MPRVTVILVRRVHDVRQIFTDGRPLPKDPQPSWLGYSVGKWEGDTFVVDTIASTRRPGWTNAGRPHSDALHSTERYRRTSLRAMDVTLTIDDRRPTRGRDVTTGASRLIVGQDCSSTFAREQPRRRAFVRGWTQVVQAFRPACHGPEGPTTSRRLRTDANCIPCASGKLVRVVDGVCGSAHVLLPGVAADSRPPPVSFSPPNAPPISAPLVPMLTLTIPQSSRRRSRSARPRARRS